MRRGGVGIPMRCRPIEKPAGKPDHGRQPLLFGFSGSSANSRMANVRRFSPAAVFSMDCTSIGFHSYRAKNAGPSAGANCNRGTSEPDLLVRILLHHAKQSRRCDVQHPSFERGETLQVFCESRNFFRPQISQKPFGYDQHLRCFTSKPINRDRLICALDRSARTRSSLHAGFSVLSDSSL